MPFYLKAIKVKSINHNASAIAIFMGKLHLPYMETLINKVQFKDFELVPLHLKCHNPETFNQRVQLRNFLCQDSGAVKLTNASEYFWTHLKLSIKYNDQVKDSIIDIAEESSTTTEGTLYIQCLTKHKEAMIKWVETFIGTYTAQFPKDDVPKIMTRHSSHTDNSASETQMVHKWTTWYQQCLAEKRTNTSEAKHPAANPMRQELSVIWIWQREASTYPMITTINKTTWALPRTPEIPSQPFMNITSKHALGL